MYTETMTYCDGTELVTRFDFPMCGSIFNGTLRLLYSPGGKNGNGGMGALHGALYISAGVWGGGRKNDFEKCR